MTTMSRAEFARHMGVNRSTVTRWIERGRISPAANGRIDPVAAKADLEATESPEPHHQARSAQIAEQKAQQAAQPHEANTDRAEVGMRLKLAMAKEREAKAELAAMERDKIAGLLVDRGEVDFLMRDIGETLRAMGEGFADRHAAALAAHHGDVAAIRQTLDDAMRDLLLEVSHHMGRKAEEVLSV